ncbi:hypothetical protein C8R43DRAFT_82415 [Mycena crocata]|nr:hypothetical protein C8R43DRAFT_82415 [Mycena crocata]
MMCGGVGITFPSIRTGISASRHTLSPAHHSRLVSPRLAPPLPPMPSLPAIPPSPSAPPSLIYFLSRMYPCSLKYSSSALWHARENTEPAQEPDVHSHSHTPAPVAHRRHPLRAPASARAHPTGMPAIPHECPRPKSASSTDMNARRHQPRQPAQTPPASSLHLRPRVESRLTPIRDDAVHA